MKNMYHFFHRHYHTRYHGIYSHAKQLFIFDLVLLAIALGMLGSALFFYFYKPGISNFVDVGIAIDSGRLKAGQETDLVISWRNRSKTTLESPTLALKLPDGFVLATNSPGFALATTTHTTSLADLPPGAFGDVRLRGTLWASVGKEEKIMATLSYRNKETGRTEQSIGAFYLTLGSSVVEHVLSMPSSTLARGKVPFVYTLTNSGVEPLLLALRSSLPSALSTSTLGLAPGETKVVTGTLRVPEKASNINFTITPTLTVRGKEFELGRDSRQAAVFAPRVLLSATLPSSTAFMEPSTEVPLTIYLKNISNFTLLRGSIRLHFSPGVIDLSATARANGLTVRENGLLVTPAVRTALTAIKPGAEDSFTLTLRTLPHFGAEAIAEPTLSVTPVFEATVQEAPESLFEQAGEPQTRPLASEVHLASEVRYYTAEGDQLGRGPLPPQVGELTKYWVFVRVNNTVNAIRNADLFVLLAPGVTVTGKQSVSIGKPLAFDEVARTLRWQHLELPADSQTGFYFEIGVTPNPTQIGKTIALIDHISFGANDARVGKVFAVSLPTLTNVLPADDAGGKKGARVGG